MSSRGLFALGPSGHYGCACLLACASFERRLNLAALAADGSDIDGVRDWFVAVRAIHCVFGSLLASHAAPGVRGREGGQSRPSAFDIAAQSARSAGEAEEPTPSAISSSFAKRAAASRSGAAAIR